MKSRKNQKMEEKKERIERKRTQLQKLWLPPSNQKQKNKELNGLFNLINSNSSGNTWSHDFKSHNFREHKKAMEYKKSIEKVRREEEQEKYEAIYRKYKNYYYYYSESFNKQFFIGLEKDEIKPYLKIRGGWNDKKYKEWIQKEFFENYFFNGIESVNTGKLHLVLIKCRNNESPAYGYAVSIEFELNKEYSVEEAKIKAFEAIAEAISLRTKSASEIEAIAEA